MVQISNLTEINENNIQSLLNIIYPILQKRKRLYNTRYKRCANAFTLFSSNDTNIKVGLETYIGDIATGYFGGKEPKYEVSEQSDKEKCNIIQKILGKIFGTSNKKEMEVLIKYITDYNDDSTEHLELVRDYMLKGACYETIYENNNNEIIYAKLDALQTVAIYDYNTPCNLIGLVRTWEEVTLQGNINTLVEIIDINGKRSYTSNGTAKNISNTKLLETPISNKWNDVPAFAIEQPDGMAVFENVISLIDAYQRVIQNSRNTFQYNDDAKLKITGYAPENSLTIQDEDGNIIPNPDRIKEDEVLLNSSVFYTPDKDGNIEWIIKSVDGGATTDHKKTLIDLISMLSGVPNLSDLGFTNADNASAIDRKFFGLEQKVALADKLFKRAYLRRWELIFDRINTKKNTKYDFTDVVIKLYRNLPTDKYTETDTALKLRGFLSDETVMNMLPQEIDSVSEMQKVDKQESDKLKEYQNKVMNNDNKDISNNKEDLNNEQIYEDR